MIPRTIPLALTLLLPCAVAMPAAAQLSENVYDVSSGELPDTQCDSWVPINTGGLEVVVEEGKLVLRTDTGPKNLGYIQSSPALGSPETLVMKFRMRLVSGSSSVNYRGAVNVGFTTGDANRKNVLHIDDGAAFLLSANTTRGPEVEIPTGDAVHSYRMEVSNLTGQIDLYQDDELVLEGQTFPDDSSTEPRVFFGETSIHGQGESEWEFFSHNASTKPRSNKNPPCGDPVGAPGQIAAGDALFALKAAVGSVCCELCGCDVNQSDDITVADAQQILKRAVGQDVPLNCPPCLLAAP